MGAYIQHVSLFVYRDTFYVVRLYYGTLLVVESIVSTLVGMRVVVVYAAIFYYATCHIVVQLLLICQSLYISEAVL